MSLSTTDDWALKCAAIRMRMNSVQATTASNSGYVVFNLLTLRHPTTCSSIAEMMSVLFLREMRYNPKDPAHPSNDRFVLSKVLPFVDVATGSLGQGLSNAAGMAYVGKYIDKASYRVFCIVGDGEFAEGSISEALNFASIYKLNNLIMLVDINRLGQSQPTHHGHDMLFYKSLVESFGWHTVVVNGHSVREIAHTLEAVREVKTQPIAVLCKTFKGHSFPGIANEDNWHGKPLGKKTEEVLAYLSAELESGPQGCELKRGTLVPRLPEDDCAPIKLLGPIKLPSPPDYKLNDEVATRLAYGKGLARLGGVCKRVIGLDGDTKNSTFSIKLLEAYPDQFIECFIAEQNMVGVGIGAACRHRTIPFVSAFAAFLTRAYDQIRMGALSMTDCNFVGSHAGVSIGEDGASQMALEDLAMFRAVLGSTVFYPSDAVSTERAVELSANKSGVCYIRTGRPNLKVIYNPDDVFEIGKGKIVRSSGPTSDVITVVAAGVTLAEAIKAAEELDALDIQIRVIDPFTIKPIDAVLLANAVKETCDTVITVEDHQPEGGIADAVSQALSKFGVKHIVHSMAVCEVPHSGKPQELLDKYKISSRHIVSAVKEVLSSVST